MARTRVASAHNSSRSCRSNTRGSMTWKSVVNFLATASKIAQAVLTCKGPWDCSLPVAALTIMSVTTGVRLK